MNDDRIEGWVDCSMVFQTNPNMRYQATRSWDFQLHGEHPEQGYLIY